MNTKLNRKIRLIGMDLDRTSLKSDKTVSPRLREAVRDAFRKNVLVVPATGRALYGLPDGIVEIREFSHVITANGAMSYRLPENGSIQERKEGAEILRSRYVDYKRALQLSAETGLQDSIFVAFIGGMGLSEPENHERVLELFRGTVLEEYSRKGFRDVKSLRTAMKEAYDAGIGVENVWITPLSEESNQAVLEILRRYSDLNIHVMQPKKYDIEIGHPEADKGKALLELGESLGIVPAEIMGIGDNANDLGMLRLTALSACPENGTESARAAADWIIRDCDHDGAAEAIEKVLEMNEQI